MTEQQSPQMTDMILAACAPSYPALFRQRVSATPDRIAFTVPIKDDYHEISWSQVRQDVDKVAAGLLWLGVKPEDRVAIDCSTRYEWIVADLGISCAGGATTTVYPNTQSDEVGFILADSGSVVAFVENSEILAKISVVPAMRDQLRAVIIFDDDRSDDQKNDDGWVLAWRFFLKKGEEYLADHHNCVDRVIESIRPDHLSTLIYTSGTTGRPKGVELVHHCWTYEAAAVKAMDFVREDDIVYLWLPLAHVFGRDVVSVQMHIGCRAVVDGRVNKIMDGMINTNPTILIGVPRIFEKIRSAVMTMYPAKAPKGRLVRWAFDVGRRVSALKEQDKPIPRHLRMSLAIADKAIFSHLRRKLGSRMRFMISGSAKLSKEVQQWFEWANITLFEGYGATETSAIATVNHPDDMKIGTVGRPIPGLEMMVADDGELLIKGPTVARGYHNLPEETAEAFHNGWYHTGDIGHFDDDGFVTITDRKKDLFKTSNGKYVAPQKVENTVMAVIPYVSQVVVIGNERKYVTALLALDPDSLFTWAKRRDKADLSYAELTQLPEIRKSIDRFVRRVNKKLERWEQIKRYEILSSELTLEEGTLTPSLKVRRFQVNELYSDLIEKMYADESRSDLVD